MEFTSTIIGQTANSKISRLDLDTIFASGYGGLLNSLIIVSAYTDVKYIEEIIKRFKSKTYKKRKGCHFSIYIDEKASRYNTDESIRVRLDECAKKIKRSWFLDDKSGIFLVSCGSLFHSKFIISKSNSYNKFIIGSINFTEKAFTKNEEIAVTIEADAHDQKNDENILIKTAEEYIKSLKPTQIPPQDTQSFSTTKSLRDLFLDGFLYREIKEQDPFRIQLNFPDDYLEDLVDRKKTSDDPYLNSLDDKKVSTLSFARIIDIAIRSKPELGKPPKYFNKKKENKHYVWKQYSVECSLGYWVPCAYRKQVEDIKTEKLKENKKLLDDLGSFITGEGVKKELKETFRKIIEAFQNDWKDFEKRRKKDCYLEDWKWSDLGITEIDVQWDNWEAKIIKKLTDKDYEKYRERLLCGVTHFSVPDLWVDPISSVEFEDSVYESIRYSLSSKEKISKKLCAGVNKELIKKEGKYDIDNIEKDKILEALSSFVSLLSFKNKLLGNKLLGEYAKEYNIKIDDLDKILGKYIEDNYEELKIESEENQIKNMKRIIDEKEFCDQQKKFK